MKKLIVTLFFAVAVFFVAIQATHATTITFNEPGLVPGFGPNPYFSGTPKGTEVTDQFAALGVVFLSMPITLNMSLLPLSLEEWAAHPAAICWR